MNHDVVEPLYVEADEIYHLASPASPPHYMFNPIKTIKTNTLGTLNILGLARRTRAKVLLASTSEVYGDPEVHPQNEEYWGHVNPIGPRFAYCTESVKSLIPRLVIVTSHAAAAVLRRNLSETVSPTRWF